ncbi:MAG: hypothetical protein J6Q31_05845 [Alistipes sp.]|nr:hypothetical protein [Alistipes sp.]
MKMVKKFVGYIFTIAVIAVIVFTVLGTGTYKSMLPEDLFLPNKTETVVMDVNESTSELDTLNFNRDSLDIMQMSVEAVDTADIVNW